MIPNITRGTRVKGLLHYLWGPGKVEEHTDPHLVAAWDGAGELADLEPAITPAGKRDERGAEAFEPATDSPVERLMYAASVLHCLPFRRAESPSAATGTVMRPATLSRFAAKAGFARVDIAPLEHDMFRFYRLIV